MASARSVTGLRSSLAPHRSLAVLILAAALLLRLLIPTGYMLAASHGAIRIELCSGMSAPEVSMPGMAHHGGKGRADRAEQPCAFAGLTAPALAGTGPIVPALPLQFILAAPLHPSATRSRSPPSSILPPARGPPASA